MKTSFWENKLYLVSLLLSIQVLLVSCATTKESNIERGYDYDFKIGYPEVKASAFGFWDKENGPTLNISLDIIKGSLIYEQENDSLLANYSIDLEAINLKDKLSSPPTIYKNKTYSSKNTSIRNSQESIPYTFNFSATPGEYEIIINVKDLNSDKNLTQTFTTFIPELTKNTLNPTDIQMSGKINGSDWQDINSYHVPGKIDSLRFVFQVVSKQINKELTINSKLLRFKSDTSRTRPMQYADFSNGSIAHKGIDYDEYTVVQSNRRVLSDYSNVFIEYKFTNQHRGNYRFEVNLKQGEQTAYKGRGFGIRSENFPHIKSPEEMIGPLAYLMSKKDFRRFKNITNSDSLKKAIDTFWLKNIGNTNRARRTIELFYQRVENANKQFSNFKEGWKTDRGMIYILFGDPWYTIDGLKTLDWFYSHNHQNPNLSYEFYQPKLESKFFPFKHYILDRNVNYYTVQYQQRQLWLSGLILQKRI